MVGPSHTQQQRTAFNRGLLVAVAVLVAASTGLVALQSGATGVQLAVAVAAGLVVGAGVSWFLLRLGRRVGARP